MIGDAARFEAELARDTSVRGASFVHAWVTVMHA